MKLAAVSASFVPATTDPAAKTVMSSINEFLGGHWGSNRGGGTEDWRLSNAQKEGKEKKDRYGEIERKWGMIWIESTGQW